MCERERGHIRDVLSRVVFSCSQGDQEILVVDLTAEEDDEDGEEVESIIIGDDPPPQKKPRKDTPETTVLR